MARLGGPPSQIAISTAEMYQSSHNLWAVTTDRGAGTSDVFLGRAADAPCAHLTEFKTRELQNAASTSSTERHLYITRWEAVNDVSGGDAALDATILAAALGPSNRTRKGIAHQASRMVLATALQHGVNELEALVVLERMLCILQEEVLSTSIRAWLLTWMPTPQSSVSGVPLRPQHAYL